MFIILPPGRLRQEDLKFEVDLGYTGKLCLRKPINKQTTTTTKQKQKPVSFTVKMALPVTAIKKKT